MESSIHSPALKRTPSEKTGALGVGSAAHTNITDRIYHINKLLTEVNNCENKCLNKLPRN
jgi:hypothetical protein